MRTYVVTTGQLHADLIRRVLQGSDLPDLVVAAGGRSRTEAASGALSLMYDRGKPVALVLDARTYDPGFVAEQEREYDALVRMGSPNVPFQLFMAVPEVEAVLFHHPPTLERILGREIPAEALFEAQFRPRVVLQRLLAEIDPSHDLGWLAERIDREAACAFARHPLMDALISFLRHPSVQSPYAEAA